MTDDSHKIRAEKIKNDTTGMLLVQGAHDIHPYVRFVTMEHKMARENVLIIGSKDTDTEVRSAAIRNNNATQAVLMNVINDPSLSIKLKAVYKKRNIPKILEIFTYNSDPNVRAAVAEHEETTPELLKVLITDLDQCVANLAVLNKNATEEVLLEGAKYSTHPYVRHTATTRPNATEKVKKACNKKFAPSIIDRINSTNAPENLLLENANHFDLGVRLAVATKATPKVLAITIKDKSIAVKICSIRNPNITLSLLKKYINHKNPDVRHVVACNSKCDVEVLLIAADDPDARVVYMAAAHPNTNHAVIRKVMLRKGYTDAHIAAMRNKNASVKNLMRGLRSKKEAVRNAAMSNPKLNRNL